MSDNNDRKALADAPRPLESTAHYTRGGGAPAPDHDADLASRAVRVEAEQQRLIQWAQANGKLGGRLPPEFSRGGEHQVYFHRPTKRYVKATLPDLRNRDALGRIGWRVLTVWEYETVNREKLREQ